MSGSAERIDGKTAGSLGGIGPDALPPIVPWCPRCGHRPASVDDLPGLDECPGCGNAKPPCSSELDVAVEVNWHELRILGIWASNYAESLKETDQESSFVVNAILARLESQFPEFPPLTMAGELKQLRDAFGAGNVMVAGKFVAAEEGAGRIPKQNGRGSIGFGRKRCAWSRGN